MLLRLLAAVVAALVFGACSESRRDIALKITPAEAKELRLVAARLYKEHRDRRAPEFLPLKPSRWPPQFKKFRPLRVGIYRDGVALALEGNAATEQGIHILPIAMELEPIRGRVQYEEIQPGVHWYRLGK